MVRPGNIFFRYVMDMGLSAIMYLILLKTVSQIVFPTVKLYRNILDKLFLKFLKWLTRDSSNNLIIDMTFSGSTIIGCYFLQNKIYSCNVGDSRAIVGRNHHKKWEGIALSTDHKPDLPKQAERIKKSKGRIQAFKDQYGQSIGPLRVWVHNQSYPGLAMTRSFGDLMGASVGVSPIPQIKQFHLTQQDKMIVIGSDGVFQFLGNQEIIEALVPYYESKKIQEASDMLINMAHRSWGRHSTIVDDITFILIFVNYNEF